MRRAKRDQKAARSAPAAPPPRPAPSTRWVIWALLAILLFAAAFDLVFYTGFCADDDLQYFRAARQIMTWGSLSQLRLGEARLAHVVAAAIGLRIGGYDLFVAGAFFIVFHLALVGLTYWVGARLHCPVTGLLAAGFVSVTPMAILFASTGFPDMHQSCWAVLAVGLILLTREKGQPPPGLTRRRLALYAGAGCAITVGYMIKESALIMLPACLALVCWSRGALVRNRAGLAVLAVLAGVVLIGLLEFAALYRLTGSPQWRLGIVSGRADRFELRVSQQGLLPWGRLQTLNRMDEDNNYFGLFKWAIPAAMVLYPLMKRRSWKVYFLFLWTFGYLTWGTVSPFRYLPPSIWPRYYILVLPWAMVMLAHCAETLGGKLWETAQGNRIRRLLVVGFVALLGLVVALHSLAMANQRAARLYRAPEVQATRYALDYAVHSDERPIVMSNWLSARLSPVFYKGSHPRIVCSSGSTDYKDVEPALRNGGFLYVESRYEDHVLPNSPPDDSPLDEMIARALVEDKIRVRTVATLAPFQSRLDGLLMLWGGSDGTGRRRDLKRAVYVREVTAAPASGTAVAAPQ